MDLLKTKGWIFWFTCMQLLILSACPIDNVYGQGKKNKISLRDSLDNKLDFSDFIIDANGFIPIPYIITERSLGGFGLALVPIFLKRRAPYIDSVNGQVKSTPVAPDITGGAAFYTVNNTWGLLAFRSGNFVKSRIKYTIGGGYAHVNMSFYKTLSQLGEKEVKFSINTVPFLLQATKRIGVSRWFAGLKYFFLQSDVKYAGDTILSNLIKPLEVKSIVSQLGLIIDMDNRDNIFTPDKGIKLHTDFIRSDNVFGSDYEYWRINCYAYMYKPLSKKIIGGIRLDGQQTFEDPPFFMLPYIDMRGIPAYRYQGKADVLSEVELRWDIRQRWSAVFFAGAGKAFDEWNDFGSSDWIFSGGSGFRYLLARKFKLRMGVDVARGPGVWTYYIVFGTSWVK